MAKSEKTRRSSRKHAEYGHDCPCGRVVHGNGGWSSHKRACGPYKQHRLDAVNHVLQEIDAGTWGKGLAASTIANFHHQYLLEAERLRLELGSTGASENEIDPC